MKRSRWIVGAVGLLLALLAVWQILAAAHPLKITTVRLATPPLTVVAPEGVVSTPRPVVLVGHGFAGSKELMRGFALALAHAGYPVVLWDFDGHGANPRPLSFDASGDALLENAEAALVEAEARGLVTPARVAILGHSMGSGAALAFGMAHPDTAATVAVSPVEREVTPTLPRNLLLMAGSLEGRFVRNAEGLMSAAGGPGGDPVTGTGRKFVVVPGVEHISILFSPAAHAAARDWLDATFGPQPGGSTHTDRRVAWYGLGVLGSLLVAAALAPLVVDASQTSTSASSPTSSPGRRLGALVGGGLGATLVLWLAGRGGLGLRDLFGLLVGGYLLLWFGIAGALSLLLLRWQPSLPSRRAVLGAMMAFAVLWLGVGLLGEWVWLPWLLIPRRLLLWPLGTVLLLPWFLAAGETARAARAVGRLGWWLAHSVLLLGCFILALQLSPELGFLVIILPMFPLVLGLHALAVAEQRGSWLFGLSGALFVSWLLLAVFPLR
jgi:pimeloyl-ACP methyl ester carboxylesterase